MKTCKRKFFSSLFVLTLILCTSVNSVFAIMKGDINKDGALTKDDALLIVEKTVNKTVTDEDIKIADLNGDNVLNVLDAQEIMKQIDSTFIVGDYNRDGKLTQSDGFNILKLSILGETPTLEDILWCDVSGDGNLRMYDAFQIIIKFQPGNMNQDDKLDIEDALIIVNKVINNDISEEDISRGDIDVDGALTIKDAQLLMDEHNRSFIVGDYNKDGIFSEDDSKELLNYLTKNGGSTIDPEIVLYCDMNNDAIVNSDDLHIMIKNTPIRGDMDGNGVITANDASMILDLYKNGDATKQQIYVGDMDNSGTLTANDASMILDLYKNGK